MVTESLQNLIGKWNNTQKPKDVIKQKSRENIESPTRLSIYYNLNCNAHRSKRINRENVQRKWWKNHKQYLAQKMQRSECNSSRSWWNYSSTRGRGGRWQWRLTRRRPRRWGVHPRASVQLNRRGFPRKRDSRRFVSEWQKKKMDWKGRESRRGGQRGTCRWRQETSRRWSQRRWTPKCSAPFLRCGAGMGKEKLIMEEFFRDEDFCWFFTC